MNTTIMLYLSRVKAAMELWEEEATILLVQIITMEIIQEVKKTVVMLMNNNASSFHFYDSIREVLKNQNGKFMARLTHCC